MPPRRTSVVVGAALDDAAAFEDEDLVGVAHGRDAMRHDDRRALAHARRAGASGSLPRCRCRPPTARRRGRGCAGRRIIARAMRGPLLLAARQRDAALADERVVAVREIRRRPCRAGRRRPRRRMRSIDDALRPSPSRRGTPKAMFSAIVSEKRNGSCGTKPIAPRSARERNLADVDAVDEDRAGRRVVQPRQQVDQRRLARARGADERRRLAGARSAARRARGRGVARRGRRRSGRGSRWRRSIASARPAGGHAGDRRCPARRRAPRASASTTPCRAAGCW